MAKNLNKSEMDHLDRLEAQSIYIFREAFHTIKKLGMLWSFGKDSNVMIWLARKSFFRAMCLSRLSMLILNWKWMKFTLSAINM